MDKEKVLSEIHVLAGDALAAVRRITGITKEEQENINGLRCKLDRINALAVGYSVIYQD